jgi:hypothetical protein
MVWIGEVGFLSLFENYGNIEVGALLKVKLGLSMLSVVCVIDLGRFAAESCVSGVGPVFRVTLQLLVRTQRCRSKFTHQRGKSLTSAQSVSR